MFEEARSLLDAEGIDYTEDVEAGTVTIEIGAVDKLQLVNIISAVNNAGAPFTIDESQIVISGLQETPTAPEEEMPMDAQAMAFDEYSQG